MTDKGQGAGPQRVHHMSAWGVYTGCDYDTVVQRLTRLISSPEGLELGFVAPGYRLDPRKMSQTYRAMRADPTNSLVLSRGMQDSMDVVVAHIFETKIR